MATSIRSQHRGDFQLVIPATNSHHDALATVGIEPLVSEIASSLIGFVAITLGASAYGTRVEVHHGRIVTIRGDSKATIEEFLSLNSQIKAFNLVFHSQVIHLVWAFDLNKLPAFLRADVNAENALGNLNVIVIGNVL